MHTEGSETVGGFDLNAPIKRILGLRGIVRRRKAEGFRVALCRENLSLHLPKGARRRDVARIHSNAYAAMRDLFSDNSFIFPRECLEHLERQLSFLQKLSLRIYVDRAPLRLEMTSVEAIIDIMRDKSLEFVLGEEGMDTAREIEGDLMRSATQMFYPNTSQKIVDSVLRVYSTTFAYANLHGKICIVTPRTHFDRVLRYHRDLTQDSLFYPEVESYH